MLLEYPMNMRRISVTVTPPLLSSVAMLFIMGCAPSAADESEIGSAESLSKATACVDKAKELGIPYARCITMDDVARVGGKKTASQPVATAAARKKLGLPESLELTSNFHYIRADITCEQ